MNQCNTCQTYKLQNNFPMTKHGYRRHICDFCYEEYLEKHKGQRDKRNEKVKEAKR